MTDIDRRSAEQPTFGPEQDEDLLHVEAGHPSATVRSVGYKQIPVKVALVIGLAWVAGVVWLMGISPTPPADAAAPTGLDLLVQTAMFGSWMAVLAGIAARHRFLFGASIVGGVVLAGAGFLCLATGHTGLWIPAQIGTGVGLAGLGYGASRIA